MEKYSNFKKTTLSVNRYRKGWEKTIENISPYYHENSVLKLTSGERVFVCYNKVSNIKEVCTLFNNTENSLGDKRKRDSVDEDIIIEIWNDPRDSIPRQLGKRIISSVTRTLWISYGFCRDRDFVLEEQNKWISAIDKASDYKTRECVTVPYSHRDLWKFRMGHVLDTFFICPLITFVDVGKTPTSWIFFTRYIQNDNHEIDSDIESVYVNVSNKTQMAAECKKQTFKISNYNSVDTLDKKRTMRLFACDGKSIFRFDNIHDFFSYNRYTDSVAIHTPGKSNAVYPLVRALIYFLKSNFTIINDLK